MAQEPPRITGERKELPIERGFPIERINEIAQKETRAKMHYRPIYTMHKWWARRLGCVFRSICLYSLLDDPDKIEVHEPGENGSLGDYGAGHNDIQELIENVDLADSESLWQLYSKDVRVDDKKILDPFMGGGTSLVEASRFGVEADGYDLNPVAWFSTKKEIDAGKTDIEKFEAAFEQIKSDVADEILSYYTTPCPNGNHDADVMYNFWAKELDCLSCGTTVPLFRDFRIAKGRYENDDKYNVLCPACEEVVLVDDWREKSTCSNCTNEFTPQEGNIDYGKYICPDCGQKYPITDAIEENGGFEIELYAVEYYCATCEQEGRNRAEFKGYKSSTESDIALFESAKEEWEKSTELREYVPDKPIRPGWKTDANQFEGSMPGNGNLPRHGYHQWTDMYNERQLLCLSKLFRSIERLDDQNIKEFLIIAVSDALRTNSMMVSYDHSYNKIDHVFRDNNFNPPLYPTENNVWGTKYGRGSFLASLDMVRSGIEYAQAPTERYVEDGETKETKPFSQPIGENVTVNQGDARLIEEEDEYDCVITDPPYYNNVLYSELSDYYYVWLKQVLDTEYECFEPEHTPRTDSIVVNPASNKGDEEYESELKQAFSAIKRALKDDGVLTFTYHHSNSESWGELLEALCHVGFEVTATYPVSADISKFLEGESVEFDIVIVARPAEDRQPISWNSLRRNIVRTAKQTHQRLTKNRELSDGDIGVIEMGRAFHEYSKHHGEVQRDGEVMSAKEVVDEIYGIIQQGSDIGEVDVFLDLLELDDPTYNDMNMLSRGTSANPDSMKDNLLYRMEAGEFVLGTWKDEKRQAYIQQRVNAEADKGLTPLDKAQFLRHRYEQGKSIQNYLDKWTVSDDLRELCEELADVSDDDVYRRILGANSSLDSFSQ
jgi:adenine-specific DNA methylase